MRFFWLAYTIMYLSACTVTVVHIHDNVMHVEHSVEVELEDVQSSVEAKIGIDAGMDREALESR